MNRIAADAVVLRLVDHQEKNRVVTLFTPEWGRLGAYARGARGSKHRFGGHLDLFHRGTAELLASKRGGLYTLASFTATQAFEPIRADVIRFAIASFIAELAMHTSADGDGNPRQFEVLVGALDRLASGDEPARRDLILAFQLQWFDAMGELPPLTADGLLGAQLPFLDDQPLAIAAGLLSGVQIPNLDPARFEAVGALTRALRHRLLSRPLESGAFLNRMLQDA